MRDMAINKFQAKYEEKRRERMRKLNHLRKFGQSVPAETHKNIVLKLDSYSLEDILKITAGK